jgi:hypothetical protein
MGESDNEGDVGELDGDRLDVGAELAGSPQPGRANARKIVDRCPHGSGKITPGRTKENRIIELSFYVNLNFLMPRRV